MLSLVVALVVLAPELPPECQAPPTREVLPLTAFAQSSGSFSVGLDSVATWCFDSSGTWTGGQPAGKGKPAAAPVGDCLKAIGSCEVARAGVSEEARGLLYEALTDLQRPFLGQKYKPRRSGLAERPPENADCGARDRSTLFGQAQARMDLARLSSQVQSEYANYKTWLFSEGLRCAQLVARGEKDLTRRGIAIDTPTPGGGALKLPGGAVGSAGATAASAGALSPGPAGPGATGSAGATAAGAGALSPGAAGLGAGAATGAGAGQTGGGLATTGDAARGASAANAPELGTGSAEMGRVAPGSNGAGTQPGGALAAGADSGRGAAGGNAAGRATSGGEPGRVAPGSTISAGQVGAGLGVVAGGTGSQPGAGPGAVAGGTGSQPGAGPGAVAGGTGAQPGGAPQGSLTASVTPASRTDAVPLGGPTAERERALSGPMLEKWRYFYSEQARIEIDNDWVAGFLASRELRDCRCVRPIPGDIVRRLENKDRVPQLEADDDKNTRCELCLLDVYPGWKVRAQKQCALALDLTEFELGVLQRSDDGNGLPPRCIEAALQRGKGVATAAVRGTPVAPAKGNGFIISRAPETLPPAPDPLKPTEYAPLPAREEGRVYVRIFTSAACVAEVLPGPVIARTGDLLPVPPSAAEITVRGACGGFAELYFGKEEKPRVAESFARNQPLRLQFRAP